MIPVYNALITDELEGILRVSLVDCPAVESFWVAYKNDSKKQTFSIQDEDEHKILGVVMRADFLIYRYSEEIGEYYIKYDKETIKQMAEKLMKDGYQNNINLMHLDGTDVEGVNLVQLFIKDTEKGIVPKGFEDIEDGSLFAEYKVENKEVWDMIKNGTFKGFSLEGYFSIKEELKQIKNVDKKHNFMNKLKELLAKVLLNMGAVATDKGILIWEGEENLKEGMVVTKEDGAEVEDGDYSTEDGKVITIAEGKVAKIEDANAEVKPEEVAEEVAESEEDMKKKQCMEEETVEQVEEPSVEEPAVEEPAEPEYDAKAEIEALKAEIEALKASIAEIAQKPAVEPIAEEFSKVNEVETTGLKGLDRAISRVSKLKK